MKKNYLISFLLIVAFVPVFAQDFALKQLEESPRHHEWAEVPQGNRKVYSFVAYPEKNKKTPAVVVIHENRGLTDWARSFADQIAGEGYIAIAPDLLSNFSDSVKRTSDFADSDKARNALYLLKPEQITKDLDATVDYVSKLPSCNGKVIVVGFCWGGSQCFRYATSSSKVKAYMVFYGGSPADSTAYQNIQSPVYGFYAENDQRINEGIAKTEKQMKSDKKKFDYKIYKGAGHAFMRSGDDPKGSPENKKAREDAWIRLKEILKKL